MLDTIATPVLTEASILSMQRGISFEAALLIAERTQQALVGADRLTIPKRHNGRSIPGADRV